MIANDVSDELEKREDQHQHDKAGEHQNEHSEELAHDIGVEQAREKPSRNNADRAGLELFEQLSKMRSICLTAEARLGCSRQQAGDCAQDASAACHLPEQKTADGSKQQIGHPHA